MDIKWNDWDMLVKHLSEFDSEKKQIKPRDGLWHLKKVYHACF